MDFYIYIYMHSGWEGEQKLSLLCSLFRQGKPLHDNTGQDRSSETGYFFHPYFKVYIL